MNVTTEQVRLAVPGAVVDEVSAVVHRPGRPRGAAVFLTHGAGGTYEDAGLAALAHVLAERGHVVVRANLPYREAGRGSPPRADRCVPDYVAVFDAARAMAGPRRPWVAGGKSYGGRVASLAAAGGLDCVGLLFYGYPLHPPGKPENLRVEHWPDIPVPCLFLQGSRDPFGGPDEVQDHIHLLQHSAQVEAVDGGDHSLKIAGKRSPDGRPWAPARVFEDRADRVATWVGGLPER